LLCVVLSLLVLVGIAFGAVIDYTEPSLFPEYSPDLFFHWLLPPIILEAAYSLYHPAFLNNLATILLFAVVVRFLIIIFLRFTMECANDQQSTPQHPPTKQYLIQVHFLTTKNITLRRRLIRRISSCACGSDPTEAVFAAS
jgi:hypothetical protein